MSEEQTLSTLRFASQAKTIQNHAKVNEVLDNQATISRLKKEMEDLKKQLAAATKVDAKDMLLESMKEQLEKERTEREEQQKEFLRLEEELKGKIITSSQPAPPRKSIFIANANANINKRNRRETWCGPAMRRNMRHSMAPSAFLRPSPVAAMDVPPMPDFDLSSSLSMAPEVFEDHLKSQEEEKLEEIEDENWLQPVPSPAVRRKRKTVNFCHSPQFLSPRRKMPLIVEQSTPTDDGGTPKAVIRDKYKRVSIALSSREQELERERLARMEAESELQELQEFTRLEDESGVNQERKNSMEHEGFNDDNAEKVKFLEKSFKDAERLNLELKKELNDKRNELNATALKLQDLQTSHDHLRGEKNQLDERVSALEPLASEVKVLKEKSELLERNKEDFDINLELAVAKKETIIVDLKQCLESAYEEISLLENSNKEEVVKRRFNQLQNLQEQISNLQKTVQEKNAALEESENSKNEFARIKEEFNQTASELERISKENEVLKEASKDSSKSSSSSQLEGALKDLDSLKKTLADKESVLSNMELSNESLLENIDKLNRDFEEVSQLNTNLLVSNNDLKVYNNEFQQEIEQLKTEAKDLKEEKEKLEIEESDIKAENEELKAALNEKEILLKQSQEQKGANEDESLRTLLSEKMALEVDLQALKNDHDVLKDRATTLEHSTDDLNKLNDELNEQIKSSDEEKKNIESKLELSNTLVHDLRDEVDQLKEKYFEATNEKELIESKLKALEATRTEVKTVNLQDELAAAFGDVSVDHNAVEDREVSLLGEIEKLKGELSFANEEKRKLETSNAAQQIDGKSMMDKLSATLTCIEESFVVSPDAETSLMDDSAANRTLSGTGISVEAVLEIKNQLLMLQEQMGSYDPEELKVKENQIQVLTKEKDELAIQVASMKTALQSSSTIHEEYEDKMADLRKQHSAELEELESKEKQIRDLLKEKEDLASKIASLESLYESSQVQGAADSGPGHVDKLPQDVGSTLLVTSEYEEKIEDLKIQLQSTAEELSAKEELIISLTNDKELLSSNMTSLENAQELSAAEYEAKIGELKKRHEAEVAVFLTKTKEDMASNLAALEETLRMETEAKSIEAVTALRDEHSREIVSLEEVHKVEKELLAKANEEVVSKLEAATEEFEAKVTTMVSQNEVKISEETSAVKDLLRQEYEAKMDEMKRVHDDEVHQVTKTMEESLESQMTTMKSQFQDEISSKEAEAAELKANLVDEYEKKIEEMKNQLQDEALSKLKEVVGSQSTLAEEYESKIKELKERHHIDVEKLSLEASADKDTLRQEYEMKVDEIKKSHEDEVREVTKKMEESFESKLYEIKNQLQDEAMANSEAALTALRDEHNREIENLLSQNEVKISEEASAVRDALRHEYEMKLVESKKVHDEEVHKITLEVEGKLESQVSMMKNQLQDEASSKLAEATESTKSTLVEEYEIKIEELNKRHQDEIENTFAKLKKEFEEKFSIVKVEYQDELAFKSNEAAEMQIILKSEIEALKEQMEEDKIAIKQGHDKIYDDKIHEMTERHEEHIKTLKDNFENEEMKYKENENQLHENLQKEIQNMKSNLEEVTQNMSTEMEELRNHHVEQLQSLKQEHNEEIKALKENFDKEEIKAKEKEIEIHEEYEVEMDELKRSHKEALDNLDSKYKAEMEKFSAMESQVTAVEELRAQVSRHQQFEEHLYKENTQLKEALAGAKQGSVDSLEVAELRRQHEAQVAGLMKELGDKNIALASLKVDVDRGELQYKKKCDILQVGF